MKLYDPYFSPVNFSLFTRNVCFDCICLFFVCFIHSTEENTKEVSLYAKNYLPILFNLYSGESKEGDPDKLPILETIRTYLSITDHKVSSLTILGT